jgi:hypothetical protein
MVFLYLRSEGEGGILVYPCVSVCLPVSNKLSSQFPQGLLIADTQSLGMSYGGIHFCMNLMSTSCSSVRLSVECISSQFPQQLLIADA